MPDSPSIDPAARKIIRKAKAEKVSTVFSRTKEMRPCPIGLVGACCKVCHMGPCRLLGSRGEEKVGVCGATLATVAAREFARAVAAGAAAHSDHGRDLALALLNAATGKAPDYRIKDQNKLRSLARFLGIETGGLSERALAEEFAERVLADFGSRQEVLAFIRKAPAPRQELWRKEGLVPRGIDREVAEMLHRTNMGTDQEPEHLLDQALRTSLADGWGGSMIATEISDVLFGTPRPLTASVNLGVLKEDEVNIVVHGHEPLLSEMMVEAVKDPELVRLAESKGARGINLAGICCTSNEVLMRHGISPVGNFTQQELAILTGAVDVMVVDVQCVMEALAKLASKYHTKLITTSPKAKISGAIHMPFMEDEALSFARKIVRIAVENFSERGQAFIPKTKASLVAGFSHEYISYMLGGTYASSYRPLNDAILDGRLQGVVAVVGCNNPRVTQDEGHYYLARELIRSNVLVVQTGCGALASAKQGLMRPEAKDHAGPILKLICETVGIPPVLHMGSCVNNARILSSLSQMVADGGLGEDISQLPVAAVVPEWMCEKSLAIGTYFAASGVYVLYGVGSPVAASRTVTDILNKGWERKTGGKIEFEPNYNRILEKVLDHLRRKRQELGAGTERQQEIYGGERRKALTWWRNRLKNSRKKS